MKIAALQTVSTPDVDRNLAAAGRLPRPGHGSAVHGQAQAHVLQRRQAVVQVVGLKDEPQVAPHPHERGLVGADLANIA